MKTFLLILTLLLALFTYTFNYTFTYTFLLTLLLTLFSYTFYLHVYLHLYLHVYLNFLRTLLFALFQTLFLSLLLTRLLFTLFTYICLLTRFTTFDSAMLVLVFYMLNYMSTANTCTYFVFVDMRLIYCCRACIRTLIYKVCLHCDACL